MNSGTKAAPVSASIADHNLVEALQKFARVQRELGNEELVAWALRATRSLDLQAEKIALTKASAADAEIRAALAAYRATAEAQGRLLNLTAACLAVEKLDAITGADNRSLIKQLEQSLIARIDAVAADTKRKK